MRMTPDLPPEHVCHLDDRDNLLGGHGLIYPSSRLVENASAARDFDEVRAVLDDLAHRALAVVGTRTQTGAVFGEEFVHVLAITVDIAMPPENRHPACGKDARAWYLAGRYAVAQRIDCVLFWRAGVCHGRKAREKHLACVRGTKDGLVSR